MNSLQYLIDSFKKFASDWAVKQALIILLEHECYPPTGKSAQFQTLSLGESRYESALKHAAGCILWYCWLEYKMFVPCVMT